MFVVITCDRSGEELDRYELDDDEPIEEPRFYAERHAARTEELEVSKANGAVPLGCGDFTVTLTDYPGDILVSFLSESFFWK